MSAGTTQAFAPLIGSIDSGTAGISAGRTFAAAVVGGASSVLGGGKFANGAVTGAFSRLFNDDAHDSRNDVWNRKGVSGEIVLEKTLALSGFTEVNSTKWQTIGLNDGVDIMTKSRILLRRFFRALSVTGEQFRHATYGQIETYKVHTFKAVYDVVNGNKTNIEYINSSERISAPRQRVYSPSVYSQRETRTCFFLQCL